MLYALQQTSTSVYYSGYPLYTFEEEQSSYNSPRVLVSFDQVFHRHYPALCRYTERLIKRKEVAEEIAADVLLQYWAKKENFTNEIAVGAFLFRAARYSGLNWIRDNRKRIYEELREEMLVNLDERAGEVFAQEQGEMVLRNLINNLPERCRRVFHLILEGRSTLDIAAELGLKASTVRNQKARGLKLLANKLSNIFFV